MINVYQIYEIANVETGERYVGSSRQYDKRKNKHLSTLRKGEHKNVNLQKAFNQYGEKSFEFTVIETACTYEESLEREQHYMDKYRESFGLYNVLPFAGKARGRVYRESTLRKMSETAKGRVISQEQREKISLAQRGRKLPEDVVEKMRESQKKRAEKIRVWDHAKMTEENVRDFLTRVKKGERVFEIYEDYPIAYSTACKIARGESWKTIYKEVFGGESA